LKDPLDDAPPVESRKAVTGIAIAVVGLVLLVLARPSAWVTVAIVIGLFAMIMLHEAGHCIMAKRAGMKVTEFFVGFGPRIWSFRSGETEYGVKAIPLGGYVRIIGMSNLEEVDPADEARTYRAGTTANKLKVILAGVTVNLILAVLLLFTAVAFYGIPAPSTDVSRLTEDSAAAAAGIETGDKIVAIDGAPIDSWDELGAAVRPNGGRELLVTVERDGELIDLTATPKTTDGEGKLGVYAGVGRERYTPLEAVPKTFVAMWDMTSANVRALGDLFSPAGVERYGKTVGNPDAKGAYTDEERPRSILGIVADGDDIVNGSVWVLFALLAMINIFLAFVNLIPLPPFDGGHAAVAVYEAIASRVKGEKVQVDYRKLMPVAGAVLVVFLALGLSAMYLDVRSMING
jgi:membrane-associated protease RseP (regulator of RpoE activity)